MRSSTGPELPQQRWRAFPRLSKDDALPLWVADMDFACASPLKALHERIDKKIFGYTMYDTDECLGAVLNWYKKRYGWESRRRTCFSAAASYPLTPCS